MASKASAFDPAHLYPALIKALIDPRSFCRSSLSFAPQAFIRLFTAHPPVTGVFQQESAAFQADKDSEVHTPPLVASLSSPALPERPAKAHPQVAWQEGR